MATAVITPDQDAVTAEIMIAAPPERVFQAITDPRQTAQWWGQKGMYRASEWHTDVRPGGKWWTVGLGKDGKPFRVEGEYLEVDPPRLLVHTWNPSYRPTFQTTVVRWELEPHSMHTLQHSGPARVGTGTLLKLRHSGFAGNLEVANEHGSGWTRVLGWMQAFVEKGETVETRVA
ncbi:MAG TPA: SRPBCC domain-containing protein [Terriglobales bacterium]|nr:SRPBCC domain-containing protein [Terriglobales bacterium]